MAGLRSAFALPVACELEAGQGIAVVDLRLSEVSKGGCLGGKGVRRGEGVFKLAAKGAALKVGGTIAVLVGSDATHLIGTPLKNLRPFTSPPIPAAKISRLLKSVRSQPFILLNLHKFQDLAMAHELRLPVVGRTFAFFSHLLGNLFVET